MLIQPETALPSLEQPVWGQVDGLWQPIYGGFSEQGVSIEWHDFSMETPLLWSESFHHDSLEICLNYTGVAEMGFGGKSYSLGNEQIAIYTTGGQVPSATRQADSRHRFLTLEFSVDYLREQFSSMLGNLTPGIRQFLESPERHKPWLEVGGPLPCALLSIRLNLLQPPVSASALEPWYQGKILEVLAQTLFRPDNPQELFCQRHKRRNRERIERAQYLLQRDIENPPSLEMLANEVGCSPFYLSRLFAEETGVSLPKYLRLKRVERAGDLLQEGMSVTDAAMAVGYSSLSAFHKAFVERHGVSPSQYGILKRKPKKK